MSDFVLTLPNGRVIGNINFDIRKTDPTITIHIVPMHAEDFSSLLKKELYEMSIEYFYQRKREGKDV